MFKVFAITLRKVVKFSPKPKNLAVSRGVRYFFILILPFLFVTLLSYSQVETPLNPPGDLPFQADSTVIVSDSIPTPAIKDSTVVKTDSVAQKGDIETTIKYSARDSIRASIDGKKVWLYGQGSITYGEIKLDAEEIEIDYDKSTLTAIGKRDSLGKIIGYPIFQNGNELYETHDII
jgi:hypothetical protein